MTTSTKWLLEKPTDKKCRLCKKNNAVVFYNKYYGWYQYNDCKDCRSKRARENVSKNRHPFCFICGSTKALVGLDLIATKQEDRKFKKQIYYQVCERHIPNLLIFLIGEKGIISFGLWKEVD